MELATLQDLYKESLADTYSAEKQALKAYPKMIESVSNEKLKAAFQEHMEQTKNQVERLNQIFKNLGGTPEEKLCHGMEGILKEATEMMEEDAEPEVKDAGVLAQAQHAEHYEIAAYGTLRTYAEELKRNDDVELLEATLKEEKETDEKLTTLATSVINLKAI